MTAGAETMTSRFGRVQVEMLECVYQHRLLSTAQLHALYRDGLALRRTQRALASMERVGWLDSVRAPGGMKLWFVTERGAVAVEAIGNRAELRRKLVPREQAAGPLQQHTLAVNEVGLAFVRAARERGDECGPLAWRNEIAHPLGSGRGRRSEAVIADAVLSYEELLPDSTYTYLRFVELDRATMATETLVAKLGRYVDLHANQAPGPNKWTKGPARWLRYYSFFPAVLVVLANGSRRRLEHRRRLTVARWTQSHGERTDDVWLYVCLLEDLVEQGPFAAIFKCNREDGLVDWLGNPASEPEEPEPEPAELPTEPELPPEPWLEPEPNTASPPKLAPLSRESDDDWGPR